MRLLGSGWFLCKAQSVAKGETKTKKSDCLNLLGRWWERREEEEEEEGRGRGRGKRKRKEEEAP
jgi:hypothetical protein